MGGFDLDTLTFVTARYDPFYLCGILCCTIIMLVSMMGFVCISGLSLWIISSENDVSLKRWHYATFVICSICMISSCCAFSFKFVIRSNIIDDYLDENSINKNPYTFHQRKNSCFTRHKICEWILILADFIDQIILWRRIYGKEGHYKKIKENPINGLRIIHHSQIV